jgi:folate-binding protein YgfZ
VTLANTTQSEALPRGAGTATSIVEDYKALTSAVAVRVLADRIIVRMIGDDRVSFLHGMCSNDIKGLAAGAIVPALFLTEHAHVIADCFIWATDDALLIDIDRDAWPRVRAHLERLLVADDVEMEELGELAVIDVEGPNARDAIRGIAGKAADILEPWRHTSEEDFRIASLPRFGASAFTILAASRKVAELIVHLCAPDPGAQQIGDEALEVLRIEHGLARIGVDAGEKTIALEARLNPAISFNKGCYLGQETIERATARGALKKRLYGLRIDGPRAPAQGAPVMLDGKEVGHLTSVAISPRFGTIGLGILHHSAWNEAAEVSVRDGYGEVRATVSDLPFK